MAIWSDIADIVGEIAPTLGTILGGPVGGAAGALVAKVIGCVTTPDAVARAIQTNPDAAVKIKELEVQEAVTIAQLKAAHDAAVLAAETSQVQAINTTIQTEAASHYWLEANWHAIGCLWALGLVTGIYFVLSLLHIPNPAVPESAWLMIGAILGVTGWRKPDVIDAKNNSK